MSRLQAINRDYFAAYKDLRQTFRKYRLQTKRNQKWLQEASYLLNCWQALAECNFKTASSINDNK